MLSDKLDRLPEIVIFNPREMSRDQGISVWDNKWSQHHHASSATSRSSLNHYFGLIIAIYPDLDVCVILPLKETNERRGSRRWRRKKKRKSIDKRKTVLTKREEQRRTESCKKKFLKSQSRRQPKRRRRRKTSLWQTGKEREFNLSIVIALRLLCTIDYYVTLEKMTDFLQEMN